MRRVILTAVCAAALFLTSGAPAFGDSHNKPLFAAAGQDLDSSHVLVAPHGRVPDAQTMECTVTELVSGESETLPMLIKPATH